MHGGAKIYHGSAVAARRYLEVGRGRAEDYYFVEGPGIAERYLASPDEGVRRLEPLSGTGYEAWVAGLDPDSGMPKGRLRHDAKAVRFLEVIVNGPKSWSLAAELHPDISHAYDAAQDSAARQIIGWLAQHATARVGPRGGQVQVPVARIEAAVVRHHTSRAGDPHRHLHLQVNARVLVDVGWRGLHTVGVRDSIEAINGIGHAAVMTDPGFRAALAAHGYTLDSATGEIGQLAKYVGRFSARAAQIGRNIERYERQWRATNPGREPGPALRRIWDARAWADARPDKVVPSDGAQLTSQWVAELRELGYRDPAKPAPIRATSVGGIDRDGAVVEMLSRLAARHSAWNAADIRGQVEQLLARHGIVTDPAVRGELAEDLTARTLARCVPLLERVGLPEHLRALTSRHVLEVEADLTARFAARGTQPSAHRVIQAPVQLDATQRAAVQVLVGGARLVVVEGAAGAGKTTTLAATRAAIDASGHRLIVVTPTRKAAQVAAREIRAAAFPAAWLAHQHGYRWDDGGVWTRLAPDEPDPSTGTLFTLPSLAARLGRGDLLLVDEAGMLDQDTARALLTIADEAGARVALVGDRHQLPAVGRGGVLDLAARYVHPDAHATLDAVHRFTRLVTGPDGERVVALDEEYAALSLSMRAGEDPGSVFDALLARGQIEMYGSDADRLAAIADTAAASAASGTSAVAQLIMADTREQVAALNAAIRDRLVTTGRVDDDRAAVTDAGERVGAGDRVATRHNDAGLRVANRDQWTVAAVHADGAVTVTGEHGQRQLPAGYVREHVQLAYASTVHGAQGETTTTSHVLIGEHTSAAAAYVGMTRGRQKNLAHLVAEDVDEAREQWVAVFARDRADLGPGHAAQLAAAEAARYAPHRPLEVALRDLRQAWTREADLVAYLARLDSRATALADIITVKAEREVIVPPLKHAYQQAQAAADAAAQRAARLQAEVTAHAAALAQSLQHDWDEQRREAQSAARLIEAGNGRLGQRWAAVRASGEQLSRWSMRWQPYLPAMPTRTADLVRFALDYLYPPHITEAFARYAQAVAEQARPDAVRAPAEAEAAATRRDHAAEAYHRAGSRHSLAHYGSLATLEDPASYRDKVVQAAAEARRDLDATRQRIDTLRGEPALRALTPDQVDDEHDTWRADREHALHALYRRSAQRAADAQIPRPPEHRQWTPPTPTPSRGISR